MSDGYGNGPYRPLLDSDILPDDQVEAIIGMLPPPFGSKLVRHMMAVERKVAAETRKEINEAHDIRGGDA